MVDWLKKLREKLKGIKTYLLISFAVIVITVQFLSGVDFGVPAFPPAETIGQFAEQLYMFLIAGSFRAALNSKG